MKILLTGATGFIGSHLVKRLAADGHQVAAIVRERNDPLPQSYIYDGSLESLSHAIEGFKPDQVVHVASLFLVRHEAKDIDRLVASNILFPTQLLEAMSKAGVKNLINVGTSWQHHENAAYNPVNLYAATKQAFGDILEFYVQAHGFKAITLKLFDTYGPGDKRPKLFTLMRNAGRGGETLKMSPGEQLLDLVYVDDVVAAFARAVELVPQVKNSETYAVSSGRPLPLKEIAVTYTEAVGKKLNIEWGGLPYRPREVMAPWKGPVLPGWEARTDLRTGIARMERDASIGGLLAK